MADNELHVGPFLNLGAAAAGSAKQGELHGLACRTNRARGSGR